MEEEFILEAVWEKQLKDVLRQKISEKRWRHSLAVSKVAVELAAQYGGNQQKAYIAGLLHDCARDIKKAELLTMAEKFNISFSLVEQEQPELLHAPVGAKLAEEWFGVSDEEISEAIAVHTVGKANMNLLDKILYLADYIEPGRAFSGVEELRRTVYSDLNQGMLMAFNQSLCFVLQKGGLIHPGTVEGRNFLLLCQKSCAVKDGAN